MRSLLVVQARDGGSFTREVAGEVGERVVFDRGFGSLAEKTYL